MLNASDFRKQLKPCHCGSVSLWLACDGWRCVRCTPPPDRSVITATLVHTPERPFGPRRWAMTATS